MSRVGKQSDFCAVLLDRLNRAIIKHEVARIRCKEKAHVFDTGYTGLAQSGATKSQIQAAIVQLRRELNILSEMFEEKEEG